MNKIEECHDPGNYINNPYFIMVTAEDASRWTVASSFYLVSKRPLLRRQSKQPQFHLWTVFKNIAS
jgi:hypothetical protein